MKNIKKYFMATLAALFFFSANFAMEDEPLQQPRISTSTPNLENILFFKDEPYTNSINPKYGTIVIFNGTCSSGKSKIAKRFRQSMGLKKWGLKALDKLEYNGQDIEDLDDTEYEEFENLYGKEKNLRTINNCLCSQAINLAKLGKNVIVDTVLNNDTDYLLTFMNKIKEQKILCYSILVYCPILENLNRVEARNRTSEEERRSPIQPITQFGSMYCISPNPENALDTISPRITKAAFEHPLLCGFLEKQRFQSYLEGHYNLENASEDTQVLITCAEKHDIILKNIDPNLRDAKTNKLYADLLKEIILNKIALDKAAYSFEPIQQNLTNFEEDDNQYNSSSDEESDNEITQLTTTTTSRASANYDDDGDDIIFE